MLLRDVQRIGRGVGRGIEPSGRFVGQGRTLCCDRNVTVLLCVLNVEMRAAFTFQISVVVESYSAFLRHRNSERSGLSVRFLSPETAV